MVSPDALALVRFGLRAPDDPRIVNTVRVIDALLKAETPLGPAWRRYNGDGYGEHDDGSPPDQTGVGRAWPLLTGERAHYEVAAGRKRDARRLLEAMEAFAGDVNLLPEQVWDADDIPERGLFRGGPTGSARPLVWAHAEHIELRRSLNDGRVFDTPATTVKRYLKDKVGSRLAFWRFNQKCTEMPVSRLLRVETLAQAVVRWSADGWATSRDADTRDSGLGVHYADLSTADLPEGAVVTFTFRWEGGRWEGKNFEVKAVSGKPVPNNASRGSSRKEARETARAG